MGGSHLDAAQRLLREGRLDAAMRRALTLLQDRRTPFPAYAAAQQVEADIVRQQMGPLVAALAGEGLVPNRRLVARLKRLRARRLHPWVTERVAVELLRLETMCLGAAPR